MTSRAVFRSKKEVAMPRSKCVLRGVYAKSCIMGNQGKMAGNQKTCIRIQRQLILSEFIYFMLSI